LLWLHPSDEPMSGASDMPAARVMPGRWSGIGSLLRTLLWVALAVVLAREACAPKEQALKRDAILSQLQEQRHSRVIAMIHRQETVSVLGIPVASYIDIEDSEAVLRAIRRTPPDEPIDFILHTPGGLVLATEQIAHALTQHPGKVSVLIPHYAMSGGTLIALAADEVIMDANAVLGPVDPQIGDTPAASIVHVLDVKPTTKVQDRTLILADIAAKARSQGLDFVHGLLLRRMSDPAALELARTLSDGRWTHDYPITVASARRLGIPVSTDMPSLVYDLMDLYPQSGRGRPSVLSVPLPRERSLPGGTGPAPAPDPREGARSGPVGAPAPGS
jgi:ClpP class serine protease